MKRWFEILLLKFACWVLIERNVSRCKYVSRRDNNDMWYMGEKLDSIISRMKDKYEHI